MALQGLTTYRQNNNIKSMVLLAMFPVLLLALLGFIFLFLGIFSNSREPFYAFHLYSVLGTGSAVDLALSAIYAYWPIVIGVAAVWVLIGYFFNDAIIHSATGAQAVTRVEQPELYNLVENLCISRGLRVPKLYIVDTDAMNAYASGIDERSYAITVTSGLLAVLNKDELEAVLAHELTHIMERDTRVLIVTIVFVGMISFLTQGLWRIIQIQSFSRRRERDGNGVLVFMLIAAVAFAIGYALALVLRFAISRRREYQADAGSVDLTKNPDALISALMKISENPDLPHVPSEVRQMFIETPPSSFALAQLFDTHPPIAKRIAVLEQLGGHAPDKLAYPAPTPAIDAQPSPEPHQHGPWGSRPPIDVTDVMIYIINVYHQDFVMQVAKWGNSLAVRLPKKVVDALALKEGDDVEIVIAGKRELTVGRDRSREKALAELRALQRPLPPGFRFDRDEANER
ncbi:MAG: M48 family metalloprotease [Rhizomicrobium sp.]